MNKRMMTVSAAAVLVLWASSAWGQDNVIKREGPAMKSLPVMNAPRPSNIAKARSVKKKKRATSTRPVVGARKA